MIDLTEKNMTKKVSVFGSANLKLSPEANNQAYLLGKLLGEQGFAVMTGGYTGTMEAVSHGANEAGGNVIGVTSDEIEAYRPIGPNQWGDGGMALQTFRERLDKLVEFCDASRCPPRWSWHHGRDRPDLEPPGHPHHRPPNP